MRYSVDSSNLAVDKHRIPKDVVLSAVRIISIILFLSGAVLLAGMTLPKINFTHIPANVVVPGNQNQPKPTQITINSIGVHAQIENLGLNSDGTLEVPKKSENVGWFTGSPVPGIVGPSVLVGHLDSIVGPAVFWQLKNLKAGDLVEVTREDGTVATFKIDSLETYSQDNFPTDKVYGAIDYEGIRLITCSGTYSRLKGHYSDNLVAYGTLVSLKL